ncbi:sigma-70 family RNA polymerase sigma factor [Chitinophaga qingshengii]|uniref:Sigma-70 family RNA polymerase sigma factor n=1 Tax=Chitinophaga qingshengii TaxID=1569794 RepID=A0ABR7TL04_9BACT|nr:sigma-70 family RNA polymerase sigma factor [Chitinophaga qingshengii]
MSSEIVICERLAAGDEDAFTWLYEHYQPKLYLFVFPLTGFSRQDTDEVVQDIFVKLWLRKETLVTVQSLQAYLFMMAKNRLYDLRMAAARQSKAREVLLQRQEEAHADVQEKVQFNEYHEMARRAIAGLTPQRRRIFMLRNEGGLSLDDIAIELNISKFAVKKQLYEAVKEVKTYLKKHAGLDAVLLALIFNSLK